MKVWITGLLLAAGLVFGGAAMLSPTEAHANLVFAKQTGRGCETCHAGGETPSKDNVNQNGLNYQSCRFDDACILRWLSSLPPERPTGQQGNQAPHPYIPPPPPAPAPQPRVVFVPTPAPSNGGVPQGSYLNSCNNARMVDGILFAECRRADQTMRTTSLANPFACSGRINNMDGRLTCAAPPQQLSSSATWGAIAVSDGRGDGAGVVDRWGTGRGPTRQLAEADALGRCSENGFTGCEIKATYQGQCGAYASSKKSSGSGVGQTLAIATQSALGDCGKDSCRIAVSACSFN